MRDSRFANSRSITSGRASLSAARPSSGSSCDAVRTSCRNRGSGRGLCCSAESFGASAEFWLSREEIMASAQSDDGVVIIKKYANRRLYNTGTSTYVTLEDLAVMVKSGEDFVVYDAKTNEDITRSVLTQIMPLRSRSNAAVRSLLRLSGTAGWCNMRWLRPVAV